MIKLTFFLSVPPDVFEDIIVAQVALTLKRHPALPKRQQPMVDEYIMTRD
jgi:hypothetical protein